MRPRRSASAAARRRACWARPATRCCAAPRSARPPTAATGRSTSGPRAPPTRPRPRAPPSRRTRTCRSRCRRCVRRRGGPAPPPARDLTARRCTARTPRAHAHTAHRTRAPHAERHRAVVFLPHVAHVRGARHDARRRLRPVVLPDRPGAGQRLVGGARARAHGGTRPDERGAAPLGAGGHARDNTLTWNKVGTLLAAGRLASVNVSATAASLSTYVCAASRPRRAVRPWPLTRAGTGGGAAARTQAHRLGPGQVHRQHPAQQRPRTPLGRSAVHGRGG